jgi:hypothetical protein
VSVDLVGATVVASPRFGSAHVQGQSAIHCSSAAQSRATSSLVKVPSEHSGSAPVAQSLPVVGVALGGEVVVRVLGVAGA